jgi:hypothetical protein
MSGDGILSDREKIDRAAYHEEARFYKKQQWAVTAAGVVVLGALLAVLRQQHITPLDKLLAIALIAAGVSAAIYFLNDLQDALGRVRRELDISDTSASLRGRDILGLFKLILIGSAGVAL